MMDISDTEKTNKTIILCKGLIFEGFSSFFNDGKRIERRGGVKFLKEASCTGCNHCSWVRDEIKNLSSMINVIMPEMENGALYSVRVVDDTKGTELEQIVSYTFEFFKIEKEIDKEI